MQCGSNAYRTISGGGFSWDRLFAGSVPDIFASDADAFLHVKDGAVFGDAVDERHGEVFVFEEAVPFIEAELGSDDGAFLFVPLLHEVEEQSGLILFGGAISEFVNHEAIISGKLAEHFLLRVVRLRPVQKGYEFPEVDKAASIALVDGVNEVGGCQA